MPRDHLHHSTEFMIPTSATDPVDPKRGKKRGSYNCSRCGVPKKGHVCQYVPITAATPADSASTSACASAAGQPATPVLAPHLHSRQTSLHLRRALSFDDTNIGDTEEPEDSDSAFPDLELNFDAGGLPATCLWEILKRSQPATLLSAAQVCKGWRETTGKLWRAAEELTLRIPPRSQVGIVGSLLHKCSGLVRLSLRMQSDIDGTMMACIAFSCPNLKVLDIRVSNTAVNRVTGDQLGRFISDKRSLWALKMESCSFLGSFSLHSLSLCRLQLSGLHSLSKTVFNCPNLKEVSMAFSCQETDGTNLTTMISCMSKGCPRLTSIHISSIHISHASVLALTAANLRALRMLSLVLAPEITDASVAAITMSYSSLQLLDLSGSSISDTGIGMICNAYPETLSKLLISLCPNITSSGIQFATTQLPLLELMDCGMTVCDPNSQSSIPEEETSTEPQNTHTILLHPIHQKLIIKHVCLKKLSLWGCSGLDALYLNCPELNELNLNGCMNLHPERLLLQCPDLRLVFASGCDDPFIGALRYQVSNGFDVDEHHFPLKRLADGSKRVTAPRCLDDQAFDGGCDKDIVSTNKCKIVVDSQ